MKKIIKYAAIAFGAFIIIIVGLGIFIKIYVTKDKIVELIEANINARVEIKDISVPLWASLSGITIDDVKVGPRDTEVKKPMSERKPMASRVIGFEKFNFKVAIGRLISSGGKDFQLKTLLFTKPEAHIVLFEKGGSNLDVLLAPPPEKLAALKAEALEKKKEPTKEEVVVKKETKDDEKSAEPQKPFSIKSINTVIKIGKIGIEQGNFSVNLQKLQNTIKLQNVDAFVDDILIDPQDLKNKNQAKLKIGFTALLDENKGGGVQSFKIIFRADGHIQPFNVVSGQVSENIALNLGLLNGTQLTGLAIFNRLKDQTENLKKVGINIDFLKDDLKLNKDALMSVLYSHGVITVTKAPTLHTEDLMIRLSEKSFMNIKTMEHSFLSDLILSKKHSDEIDQQVEKYLAMAVTKTVAALPDLVKKQVGSDLEPKKLKNRLLAPAIDKETGLFRLSAESTGAFSNPKVVMTKPKLEDPQDMLKKAVADLSGNIKDAASKFVNEKIDDAKKLADQKKKELEAQAQAEADRKKKEAEAAAKKEAEKKAQEQLGNVKKTNKLPF